MVVVGGGWGGEQKSQGVTDSSVPFMLVEELPVWAFLS